MALFAAWAGSPQNRGPPHPSPQGSPGPGAPLWWSGLALGPHHVLYIGVKGLLEISVPHEVTHLDWALWEGLFPEVMPAVVTFYSKCRLSFWLLSLITKV